MNYLVDIHILKFGLVGIMGMGIDFATTWICKEKWAFNKFLSNSIGFTLAVINNYLLNAYWTFGNASHSSHMQLLFFLIISIVGLCINNALLYIFLRYINNRFYLLKIIIVGLVFFWNYSINYFVTFR